jgi:hypothetical protein
MKKFVSTVAALCLATAGTVVVSVPAWAYKNVSVTCDTADAGGQYVFTCSGKGDGVTLTNVKLPFSKTGANGVKLGPLVGSKVSCLLTNPPASLNDCKPI